MKVCFFLQHLSAGGAERQALELGEGLRPKGWEAQYVVYRGGTRQLLSGVRQDGVRYLNADGLFDPAAWRSFSSAAREFRPDLIVAVNQTCAIVEGLSRVTVRRRTPVAVSFHTTLTPGGLKTRLREAAFFAAVRRAAALIYVSRNQERHWSARGLRAKRVETIVNGVDVQRFAPAAERDRAKKALGLDPGLIVAGTVGRFHAEKNQAQLVLALAQLVRQGAPIAGVFVGDGPLRPEVEALARREGVERRLVFAGEHADVRPYLAAFDVGVLCSTSVETLSLAALEIMASGTPMIMSEVGGAGEIVENGVTGFLFPPGDTAALAQALGACMHGARSKSMGEAARERVRTRFNLADMVGGYDRLFTELAVRGS